MTPLFYILFVADSVFYPHYEVFETYSVFFVINEFLFFFEFLFFALIILSIISLIFLVTYIFVPQELTLMKQSPYECGFEPIGETRKQFNIQFYLVGILFLLFDLEMLLFFSWIFSIVEETIFFSYNFLTFCILFGLLTLGFFYEWCNGALQWHNK
jgi:NADH-quinone oxidoreductase subunit A